MSIIRQPATRRQCIQSFAFAGAIFGSSLGESVAGPALAGRTRAKLRKAALRFREADRAEDALRADATAERKARGGPISDDLYRRIDAAAGRWCMAKDALEDAMRDAGVEGVLVDGSLVTRTFDQDAECWRVAVVDSGKIANL
jgi:hypothetical protein